jgi:hypothetical protein
MMASRSKPMKGNNKVSRQSRLRSCLELFSSTSILREKPGVDSSLMTYGCLGRGLHLSSGSCLCMTFGITYSGCRGQSTTASNRMPPAPNFRFVFETYPGESITNASIPRLIREANEAVVQVQAMADASTRVPLGRMPTPETLEREARWV